MQNKELFIADGKGLTRISSDPVNGADVLRVVGNSALAPLLPFLEEDSSKPSFGVPALREAEI